MNAGDPNGSIGVSGGDPNGRRDAHALDAKAGD